MKTKLEMAAHHYEEATNYQAMAMDRWHDDNHQGASWALRMASDCLSLASSALASASLDNESAPKHPKSRKAKP